MELTLDTVLTETENQHMLLPAEVALPLSLVSLTKSGRDQKQKSKTDFLRLSRIQLCSVMTKTERKV